MILRTEQITFLHIKVEVKQLMNEKTQNNKRETTHEKYHHEVIKKVNYFFQWFQLLILLHYITFF